jgi:tau tubulin kinase
MEQVLDEAKDTALAGGATDTLPQPQQLPLPLPLLALHQNGDSSKETEAETEPEPEKELTTIALEAEGRRIRANSGPSTVLEVDASGFKSKHSTSVAATANEATSERRKAKSGITYAHPIFGRPLAVETSGNFPAVGSTLGHFFCLGRLGKGTFSSIHKCVNLNFFHENDTTKRRLAAAKVELSSFAQSGVLEAEATILHFLDQSLPRGTVPVYMGHYRSGEYAAILMEYFPGEDMHQVREDVMTGSLSRRVSVKDAVYLAADVMLPLLQRMHQVGIVHRDVKPSNCVRSGGADNKDFCMVDFGLSKSIVVPSDSQWADRDHPWDGDTWLKPDNFNGDGCFRNQREIADFRGTSMYASLRVHQLKDYCPRDDVWSLLYVFCDLVSGGLPWMSHAATRDREMCKTLKEKVLGDGNGTDEMEQMLMGDAYHVTLFKREKQEAAGERPATVPEPLPMHKDQIKVAALRKAFQHVAGLKFWDKPDYALVRDCIYEFLKGDVDDPAVKPVDWEGRPESPTFNTTPSFKRGISGGTIPGWHMATDPDPLEENAFEGAEAELLEPDAVKSDKTFMGRLAVDMRFRVMQMEFNMERHETIPSHLALRDWMNVVIPLLYDEWDSRKYEDGGHRTATDEYRRENYLTLLKKCEKCSNTFKQKFRSQDCFYRSETNGIEGETSRLERSVAAGPLAKKRRILSDSASSSSSSNFVTVSRALFGLRWAIKTESGKKSAPPKLIQSFGF